MSSLQLFFKHQQSVSHSVYVRQLAIEKQNMQNQPTDGENLVEQDTIAPTTRKHKRRAGNIWANGELFDRYTTVPIATHLFGSECCYYLPTLCADQLKSLPISRDLYCLFANERTYTSLWVVYVPYSKAS